MVVPHLFMKVLKLAAVILSSLPLHSSFAYADTTVETHSERQLNSDCNSLCGIGLPCAPPCREWGCSNCDTKQSYPVCEDEEESKCGRGSLWKSNKYFFWFFTIYLIIAHIHVLCRQNGCRGFYFRDGFAIILVATICFKVVVYHIALPDGKNPCTGPVAYCSTISCVSGNLMIEGYVFMFVVLMLNAYICLRALSRFSDPGQPRLCGCLIPIGPCCWPGWPCYVGSNCSTCCSKKINSHFWMSSGEWWMRIGLVLTTMTGIIPSRAVNHRDQEDKRFQATLDRIHSYGIIFGVILVVLGFGLARGISWWHKGTHVTQKSRGFGWLVDGVTFSLLISVAVIYGLAHHYTCPLKYLSHHCSRYDFNTCGSTAPDALLSIKPRQRKGKDEFCQDPNFNCTWVTDAPRFDRCINPHCKWEENGLGIIAEYFLLSYTILLVASYISSLGFIPGFIDPNGDASKFSSYISRLGFTKSKDDEAVEDCIEYAHHSAHAMWQPMRPPFFQFPHGEDVSRSIKIKHAPSKVGPGPDISMQSLRVATEAQPIANTVGADIGVP